MNLKNKFSVLISLSITACSLPLNNNIPNNSNKVDNTSRLSGYSNNLKTGKLSFKTKGIVTYEEDMVQANPTWKILNNENASGGAYKFYDAKPTNIEDDSESSSYAGVWDVITDSNAYGGSYKLSNRPIINFEENDLYYTTNNWVNNNQAGTTSKGTANIPGGNIITNTDNNIIYSTENNSWLNSGDKTYINSFPENISHNLVGGTHNLTYKYNNNTQSQSWSDNMQGGWTNSYWNGNSTTISASAQTRSIEFSFKGTNIRIFQRKAPTMGICNIKIYDSNNQEVKNIQVDNYNPTLIVGAYTDIYGLKNDTYKVVIQGPFTKNPSSTGWTFHFDGAKVYPSIEYNFTGDNITYVPILSNKSGKVRVSIDGGESEIVDLYYYQDWKSPKKSYFNLPFGEHRITIEGLDTKNPASSGYEVNLSQFRVYPSVSGVFTGDNLIIGGLKRKDFGYADLYIDGNLVDADSSKEGINPIDFYAPYDFSKAEIVSIVKNLSNTEHRFSIVGKGLKNNSSNGRVFYIDFVGTGFPYFEKTFEAYDKSIYGLRGPDFGLVNVYIDGVQVDANKDTEEIDSFDLYRSNLNFNELINYSYFTNTQSRTIKVEQTFKKNTQSNGYKVAADYFGTGGLLSEPSYITFTGNSITIKVRKGPDMGIMLVGIDSTPIGKIDLYNPIEVFEEITFPNLSNIQHYLSFQTEGGKNILSTGYGLSIDAYSVDNPSLPVINSFTPESAGIGEWIMIEGANFNLDQTKNQVKINGINSRILGVADIIPDNNFAEEMIVEVPVGLNTDGFIEVTNTELNITGKSTTKLLFKNKPIALFNVTPEQANDISTVFEFDSSASYDIEDNQNLLYKWDFGDGTIIDFTSTKTVNHTYSTSGYKTIKMTLKDQEGKESSTDKTIYIGNLSQGWTELASIPNPRTIAATASINGKIYFLGGNSSGPRRNVYEYDINNNTWWNPAEDDGNYCNGPNIMCFPLDVQGATAFTYNGKIIVYYDRLYKMDTPNIPSFIGNWSDYGNESVYPIANNSAIGAAMVIYNNKLYIAGGIDSSINPIKKFVSFDLINRTWDTSLPDLPENFTFGGFGLVGSKFYIIGGRYTDSNASNKVRIFDFNNPSLGWSYGADLDMARMDMASAVLNNKIYLMGGRTTSGIDNKVKVYDTSTNTWSAGTDIPLFSGYNGYSSSAATVIGNQIFFISGMRNVNNYLFSNKVFKYVP